jgi:hypothetical protein
MIAYAGANGQTGKSLGLVLLSILHCQHVQCGFGDLVGGGGGLSVDFGFCEGAQCC